MAHCDALHGPTLTRGVQGVQQPRVVPQPSRRLRRGNRGRRDVHLAAPDVGRGAQIQAVRKGKARLRG
jgi:hypothetical protein